MRTGLPTILAAALLLGAVTACGPKVVREPIFESEDVRVQLRRTLEKGQPVPRGYAHPAVIADVRMAHILARLTHEDAEGRREPTIRSVHVHELAQGLSQAFLRAGPHDAVIATTFATDRRWGLFTRERMTVFRAHFEEEVLVLDFFAVEEPVAKDPKTYRQREVEIPLELPAAKLGVRLLAGEALSIAGPRTLWVDWRNPLFGRPVSLSPGRGQPGRRTILLEAEEDEVAPAAPPAQPDAGELLPELRDAQLRALDQLDAARRAGLVTEAEFQRRRRLVLEGRLEEAGYGTPPR